MRWIKVKGAAAIVHELILESKSILFGSKVVNDLTVFIYKRQAIIANRYNDDLDNVEKETYTRELFRRN